MLHVLLGKLTDLVLAASDTAQQTAQTAAESAPRAPQPPAEVVFNFPVTGWPVQNTVVTSWCVMAILLLFAFFGTRNLKEVPSGVQNFWEMIVELWVGLTEQSMGARIGRRFLPLIATSFLFILFSNWLGILPVVGTVTIVNPEGHTVPLFRSANSDLNLTAAMAVLMILVAEISEFAALGPLGYIKGLLLPNPLRWLEIVTRPLSMSFRLFGNIFAGEVLVFTMLGVAPFVLFVFLGLEMFVGLIQALIFSMLTLVFLTIATAHEREHADHVQETAAHGAH